jgi:exodeoxyribonuclease V alpha subunit
MTAADQNAFAQQLAQRFEVWCHRLAVEPIVAARLIALSRALATETEAGHVCLSLDVLAKSLDQDADALKEALLGSGWVARPDAAERALFILDSNDRIYFKRHHDYERRLGVRIAAALARPLTQPGPAALALLATLFGPMKTDGSHWQRLAAALALHRHFVVVSGGPGTGKTTTVAYLLAALLAETPTLRIALAAPTGKAATRLSAAINARAESVPFSVRAALPRQAQTVHRLLGYSPTGFRFHAHETLPIDVLVLDEASMLDLSLATQLLEAVPSHARILLLGDRDQLEAVESGAVFAQLCQNPSLSTEMRAHLSSATQVPLEAIDVRSDAGDPMADSVIRYTRTFRFRRDSAVGQLALAVRAGEVDAALSALSSQATDLAWLESSGASLPKGLIETLKTDYLAYFTLACAEGADPQQALDTFERSRVLSAQREGPVGVTALNAQLSRALCSAVGAGVPGPWYAGRPVLVTRNDALLNLYNGDVGVTLKDAAGRLRVWFRIGENLRSFSPSQLPAHDSAFAMTVHKSQGSEFDAATVILPREDSPLLTREMLYTAVTRVRHSLRLVGSKSAVQCAIEKPGNRLSGLRDQIQQAMDAR